MVTAPIPTTVPRRAAHIRTHDAAHIRRQARVRIVVVHADFARGRVPRHVGVDEGVDGLAGRFVGAPDVRAAEQAALLARVEVEFECVARAVFLVREHAQRFEDHDHARPVVVCAGPARAG